MKKIVVTGGSGGAGRFVVRDLLDHGYEVRNLDKVPPATRDCPFVRADLTDFGTFFAAAHGFDAIVHLAANPEPDSDVVTGADRFRNNTLATYNAFQVAMAHGMPRVVWASSETVLGLPFETNRPVSVPVDESHALQPRTSYALSKASCEYLAGEMAKLYGMTFVGLRLSNIHFEDTTRPAHYARVSSYQGDPQLRRFNLWSYVDARDTAQSVRLALEADIEESQNFIIAAADTIMEMPNRALIDAAFPEVPIAPGTGDHETLLSIEKARRVLGYDPQYTWRDIPAR